MPTEDQTSPLKGWVTPVLLLAIVLLFIGTYYQKDHLQNTGSTQEQAFQVQYAPVAYYFSDIAADAPGRLDKLTFKQDGTYTEMIDFIDKTDATSSSDGTWIVSGAGLVLTPATNDGDSYTFSLASSTPDSLVTGLEQFDTQSFTKESCMQITNNIWDDWLQGCWEANKAQALLQAYSSASQQ
jgi:hypothetical protein